MSEVIKYNIVLHNKLDFNECLKGEFTNIEYKEVDISKITGITEGRIYVNETVDSQVEWIDELNMYTQDQFDKNDYNNRSNKAIMMLRYNEKIFSIVYGYGRTMLNNAAIEKNFGLRTAINLISDEYIKSLATLNISDDYVDTQKQALNFVSQHSFLVNTNSEILKSISGKASKDSIFSSVYGSDNILFSANSNSTIKEILDKLIEASNSQTYKEKGFEWIDYIQSVKDISVVEELNIKLIEAVRTWTENEQLKICLNKVFDFGKIGGYFIKGMNQGLNFANFFDEIPEELFFNYIVENNNNNIQKLRSSSLYYWNTESNLAEKVDSIYNCILFETDYENEKYFLNNGDWFKIEENYYEMIIAKINSIPKSSLSVIPCKPEWDEGRFNVELSQTDSKKYKLFDKNNFQKTEWRKSKVEPADIITNDGKFLHIKKGGASSKLSHLFAQGLVSSQLLKNEPGFREFIDCEVKDIFKKDYTDSIKPEIVFGIIDHRFDKPREKFLPVFSMINLCQVYDSINNLGYTCSILPIEKIKLNTDSLNKSQKKVFDWVNENLINEQNLKEIHNNITSYCEITESTLRKYLVKFNTELGIINIEKKGRSYVYKLV